MPSRKAKFSPAGLLPTGSFAMPEDAYRVLARTAAFARFPTSPEALLSAKQQWLEGSIATVIRDGVATIPVRGPMLKSFSWLVWYLNASCYEQLALDLEACLDNPQVRTILFEIDSPGGQTSGMDEITERVFAARDRKPTRALISGVGCSAAYAIAAAAGEITITPGSIAGCLGTIVEGQDWSGFDEQMGIKRWSVVSAQTPKKRLTPTSAEGQAELQQMVNAIADVMLGNIATHRGTTLEDVLANYGEGGVLVGDAAVQAGLADRLGTSDSLHAELTAAAAASITLFPGATMKDTPKGSAAPATVRAEDTKKDEDETKDDKATVSADEKKDDKDAPKPDARITSVVVLAAVYPALVTAARTEGAAAERARISGIQALQRPGLEAVIKACVEDGTCTPDAAAMRILQHEKKQREGHLGAIAGDEAKLDPPANTTTDTEASGDDAVVGRITATYDKHRGGRRAATGRN